MPPEGIANFAFGHPAPDGATRSNPFAALSDPNQPRCERTPAFRERTGDNAAPGATHQSAPRDYFGATD